MTFKSYSKLLLELLLLLVCGLLLGPDSGFGGFCAALRLLVVCVANPPLGFAFHDVAALNIFRRRFLTIRESQPLAGHIADRSRKILLSRLGWAGLGIVC